MEEDMAGMIKREQQLQQRSGPFNDDWEREKRAVTKSPSVNNIGENFVNLHDGGA